MALATTLVVMVTLGTLYFQGSCGALGPYDGPRSSMWDLPAAMADAGARAFLVGGGHSALFSRHRAADVHDARVPLDTRRYTLEGTRRASDIFVGDPAHGDVVRWRTSNSDVDVDSVWLVPGGEALVDAANAMAARGQRMHGTPEDGNVTLGGALANGAHGFARETLVTQVLAAWVAPLDNPQNVRFLEGDVARAVVISYGAVGATVGALVLAHAANPTHVLTRVQDVADVVTLSALVDDVTRPESDVVSLVFDPYTRRVLVAEERTARPDDVVPRGRKTIDRTNATVSNNGLTNVADWLLTRTLAPQALRHALCASKFSFPNDTVRAGVDVWVPLPRTAIVWDAAYALAPNVAAAALDSAARLVSEEYGDVLLYQMWARMLEPDDVPGSLGNRQGGDARTSRHRVVVLDIVVSRRSPRALALLDDIDAVLASYGDPYESGAVGVHHGKSYPADAWAAGRLARIASARRAM